MRAGIWVAVAVSLATNVFSSSSNYLKGHAILRADDVLERPYSAVLNTNSPSLPSTPQSLFRRGISLDASNNGAIALNANGTLNITAWNTATTAACLKTLSAIQRSTNPSGNCICYNLPSLDTNTGVFEADLRLYRVSDPREEFATVPPENVKVSLQYHGASVSPVSDKELMSMGLVHNQTRVTSRQENTSASPRLVRSYMLVGQINSAKMSENMTMSNLEEVLMPTLTLSATSPLGINISTNVSLNEASFLTGLFSKSVVLSDFAAGQAAVSAKVDALRNGTIAFVMPGVHLMLFPTGTIITSIWLLLGLIMYGLGTYERIVYANNYRRSLAAGQQKRP